MVWLKSCTEVKQKHASAYQISPLLNQVLKSMLLVLFAMAKVAHVVSNLDE
jgi:hypothetical protein